MGAHFNLNNSNSFKKLKGPQFKSNAYHTGQK